MKQATMNVIAIVVFVAVTGLVALSSATGFFDFLWRGSVLFEVVVGVWFLLAAIYAVRLTWRVWR